jgi:alkanesulfonate monooxygenase
MMNRNIQIFTTPRRVEGKDFGSEEMRKLMQLNEQYAFAGILFFQNNSNNIEPWVFAQDILSRTKTQHPIIAVNPVYIHPYTAAQKIVSLSRLYGRKLYLNFITGTSRSDLSSIGDHLDHNARYDRLIEYVEVIKLLLSSRRPANYEGRYYQITNLHLPAILEEALLPTYFLAGSSEQANEAREKTGAVKLGMAKPLENCEKTDASSLGVYMGIVASNTRDEALERLAEKFRPSFEEAGEILEMSMMNTDAVWKKQLMEEEGDKVLRMEPFKNFNADCPYLVGSYDEVAAYIHNYIQLGYDHFVLDVDIEENRMAEVLKVFQQVQALLPV